jgi:hypothetical protein
MRFLDYSSKRGVLKYFKFGFIWFVITAQRGGFIIFLKYFNLEMCNINWRSAPTMTAHMHTF